MDSFWDNWVIVLLPTILVGLVFWFIMRAVMHADRTERRVYAAIEAEERKRLGQPAPPQMPLMKGAGRDRSNNTCCTRR